jgi:hypothetical protein
MKGLNNFSGNQLSFFCSLEYNKIGLAAALFLYSREGEVIASSLL